MVFVLPMGIFFYRTVPHRVWESINHQTTQMLPRYINVILVADYERTILRLLIARSGTAPLLPIQTTFSSLGYSSFCWGGTVAFDSSPFGQFDMTYGYYVITTYACPGDFVTAITFVQDPTPHSCVSDQKSCSGSTQSFVISTVCYAGTATQSSPTSKFSRVVSCFSCYRCCNGSITCVLVVSMNMVVVRSTFHFTFYFLLFTFQSDHGQRIGLFILLFLFV